MSFPESQVCLGAQVFLVLSWADASSRAQLELDLRAVFFKCHQCCPFYWTHKGDSVPCTSWRTWCSNSWATTGRNWALIYTTPQLVIMSSTTTVGLPQWSPVRAVCPAYIHPVHADMLLTKSWQVGRYENDRKCHPVHSFVTVFLCFFTRVVRLITSTMVKMSSSLSGSCLWYVLHSPAAPSTVWAQVLSLTGTPDPLNELQCT